MTVLERDVVLPGGELRVLDFLDELQPAYLDFPMQRGFTNVNTLQGLTTLT